MKSTPLLLTIFSLLSALSATVSLWQASIHPQRSLTWLAAALALLAGALAVMALRGRYQETQIKRGAGKFGWARLAVFGLAAFLVTGFVAANWLARERARTLIYPGRNPPHITPFKVEIVDYQDVTFTTPDGLRLYGWYIATRNGGAIILVHGHGGNRTQLLTDAALLANRGFGVLLYDTRNCGESEGEMNTFGLTEVNDVRGALDFVRAQSGVDPARVGLMGHSLGGAITIMAAAQFPEIRATVTESTFTSLEENIYSGVKNLLGLPPFPFAPLVVFWGERESALDIGLVRPVDQISAIGPRPVLIAHGKQDEIIPIENAYRLYEAAREPKELYVLPEAGHCCLPQVGGEEYTHRVVGFFERYLLEK